MRQRKEQPGHRQIESHWSGGRFVSACFLPECSDFLYFLSVCFVFLCFVSACFGFLYFVIVYFDSLRSALKDFLPAFPAAGHSDRKSVV